MTDDLLIHTRLEGIKDYSTAINTICAEARRNLHLFEKDYDGLGFNSESRYTSLRLFLLGNPANRLFVLAHDTRYLATQCPRMIMLLRQFDNQMFIHQTLDTHCTTPFCIADSTHYVRRFHFDDTHGLLALHDPEQARALESSYMELWQNSRPAIHTTILGL